MISKNDTVRAEITDMTPEGYGVCRIDGFVLFIAGTAVGDIVDAHILKVAKSYGYAKVIKIITPSRDRVLPECTAFPSCGGCVFRHITYEKELEIKKNIIDENFARIGGLDIKCEKIIPSPQETGYRNKAEYPASGASGQMRLGFYARHSHRVVPCEDCPLQPAFYSDIVRAVECFCDEYKIPAYDEKSGKGLLRHLYIRDGRESGEVAVCLVATGDLPHSDVLCERLAKINPNIRSITLNVNKEDTNVILSDKFKTLSGKDTIRDVLCGVEFEISPRSFYQVNHDGAEKLYSLAAELAEPEGKTVLDLYCGTGTIGLTMARRAKKLIGVEIIPEAVKNARANAKRGGIENAEFICGDAGEIAERLSAEYSPDVVIVDPPRGGCSGDTLETIAKMSPERIVMISCNSATAARDCAALQRLGFEPRRAVAVDMFPRTGHVECAILLTK